MRAEHFTRPFIAQNDQLWVLHEVQRHAAVSVGRQQERTSNGLHSFIFSDILHTSKLHGRCLLPARKTPSQIHTLSRVGALLLISLMSLAAPGLSALACTIVTEPYSSFDRAEYVFYGEVTGYASSKQLCPENPLAPCDASWGLVLRVVKPVHLPSPNVKEVELYSFGMESDCSRTILDESWIHKVPIGTLMAVAAKELPQSQSGSPRDRIALDNDRLRSVAVRLPAESNISELARSRFDYSCYWDSANHPIRDFEIRKDMLRLESAKSEADVLEILFRLVECATYFDEEDSVVRQVARRYLKSSGARKRLEDRIAGTIALRDESDSDRQLDALLGRAREGSPLYELLAGIALLDKEKIDAGLQWMKRSADHGFYPALLYVGDTYDELHADALAEDAQKADSYERSSLNAYELAAVKARRAVSENEPLGFLVLGELYERGLGGLRQDSKQAEQLYCRFLQYPDGWYPLTRNGDLGSVRCGEFD